MKPLSPAIASVRNGDYDKLLEGLPRHVREQADARYENFFCVDPHHPLLQGSFYRHRFDNRRVYRVEIGNSYRALSFIEEGEAGERAYVWFWVGSHEDYNGYKDRNLMS